MEKRSGSMKLIVAGSRTLKIKKLIERQLNNLKSRYPELTVISGMARGPDRLSYNWAVEHNVAVIPMPADWKQYDKVAGHIRNEEMAKIGTHLLAYWDGYSPGTKSMISLASKYGLKTHVVYL